MISQCVRLVFPNPFGLFRQKFFNPVCLSGLWRNDGDNVDCASHGVLGALLLVMRVYRAGEALKEKLEVILRTFKRISTCWWMVKMEGSDEFSKSIPGPHPCYLGSRGTTIRLFSTKTLGRHSYSSSSDISRDGKSTFYNSTWPRNF